jgi:uncharacterized MAPEG superfamily protein
VTPELTVLALAGLLQAFQYALMSVPANLELGPRRTLGPRDDSAAMLAALTPRTARLYRALDNHFEALILFTLAVVVVTHADAGSTFTAVCAWAYLAARILYVPAYAFGLSPWRSLIWAAGFLATTAMLMAALLA